MKYQKLRGGIVSVLTLGLATTGLLTGVQAAPEVKLADVMKKPTSTPSAPATTKGVTIVDLAVNSKQFKTLVAAVKAADLVETLSGEGPFTLFAPTDAAFAKLPKGTLVKLLKPENKAALQQVLKYHVLSGAVLSKDIKAGKVDTLAGSPVSVKLVGKKVTVNNAQVLKVDVKAKNGVAHVIDTVLIPANLKLK